MSKSVVCDAKGAYTAFTERDFSDFTRQRPKDAVIAIATSRERLDHSFGDKRRAGMSGAADTKVAGLQLALGEFLEYASGEGRLVSWPVEAEVIGVILGP